jgi:hypothetical protein
MDHGELNNPRVHAIARAHDCTVDDVHAAFGSTSDRVEP